MTNIDELLAAAKAAAEHETRSRAKTRLERYQRYQRALNTRDVFASIAEANGEEPTCPRWAEGAIREFEAEFGTEYRD